jgi:hypothetical protein
MVRASRGVIDCEPSVDGDDTGVSPDEGVVVSQENEDEAT